MMGMKKRKRFSSGWIPAGMALAVMMVLGIPGAIVLKAGDPPMFRFSHKTHVIDEEMECLDCHESAESSRTGEDNLFPDPESCLDCHEPDEYDPFDLLAPIREYSRLFSHKQHVESGETCESCHGEISRKTEAFPYRLPDMVQCLDCHEVEAVTFDCRSCHTETEELRPLSHRPNFEHNHGDLARMEAAVFSGGKDCATCHRVSFCQSCHEGDNVDRFTHPLNYEFTHALEAGSKQKECAACHIEREFCLACHRENNVLPHNHGVGWVNRFPGDGGRHRIEALNDLESCIACHEENAEQLCQSCHGR